MKRTVLNEELLKQLIKSLNKDFQFSAPAELILKVIETEYLPFPKYYNLEMDSNIEVLRDQYVNAICESEEERIIVGKLIKLSVKEKNVGCLVECFQAMPVKYQEEINFVLKKIIQLFLPIVKKQIKIQEKDLNN